MKKKEKIFIIVILLIAAVGWGVMTYMRAGVDYGAITITVKGQEMGTYSLGKNQTIKIGDTNICEIKDGEARMVGATCPDHLCENQQGPITASGGMIVCLPNQVIIEGIPSESAAGEDGVDSIS